jgi:hypothetical protein
MVPKLLENRPWNLMGMAERLQGNFLKKGLKMDHCTHVRHISNNNLMMIIKFNQRNSLIHFSFFFNVQLK